MRTKSQFSPTDEWIVTTGLAAVAILSIAAVVAAIIGAAT